ncbi:hypothetical protein EYC84_005821 [Monilinia fructicola]|uniref:Uncharacterized protein n=1 Tax=Monilinia fructicola TaxID=38448 RepID=A0A5M9JXP0_MONFR|nr:hypothetical protein EYC84_005821 [Monilinia fructicola]
MSHQRATSTLDGVKEPHAVSLKVLRLSRPSLSIQHPLPTPSPSPPPNLFLPAPPLLSHILLQNLRISSSHLSSLYHQVSRRPHQNRSTTLVKTYLLKPLLNIYPSSSPAKETKRKRRYALEAQLENATEDNPITLTLRATRDARRNWNGRFSAGDIRQVCFLVEEKDPDDEEEENQEGKQGADAEKEKREREKEREIVDGAVDLWCLEHWMARRDGEQGVFEHGKSGH